MMEFIKRNWPLKVIALVAATIAWMLIASEPELATILAVPVEYKNSPNDLEISSAIVDSVNLETRGPSGRLRDLNSARAAVVLDFSHITGPGERTFTITRSNINLPRGIELVRAIPSQLRLHFERRAWRQVPVHVRFSGDLPPGVELQSYECSPRLLGIVGPETRVNRTESVETDPVSLNLLNSSRDLRIATYVSDSQVRFQGDPEVTVALTVKKK